MGEKKVTDHHDGDDHTRTIHTTRDDGSQRIVEQKVIDTPLGELGASNTSETNIDKHGNSYTTRK